MDCCEINNEKHETMRDHRFLKHSNSSESLNMKGGRRRKMNARITLWIVIGVMFVATLFLTFKAGAAGRVETVQAVSSAAKTTASSYSGMVGGC